VQEGKKEASNNFSFNRKQIQDQNRPETPKHRAQTPKNMPRVEKPHMHQSFQGSPDRAK
jgi:hypothetical protein